MSLFREVLTKQDHAVNFIGKALRPYLKKKTIKSNFSGVIKLAFNDAMTYNPKTGKGGTIFGYKFADIKNKKYNKQHFGLVEEIVYTKDHLSVPELDQMSHSDYLQSFALICMKDAWGPELTDHHLFGRKDAETEADLAGIADVPQPEDGLTLFKDAFLSKGFTERETVALSFMYVYGVFKTDYEKTYTSFDNFENYYFQYLLSEKDPKKHALDKILLGDSSFKENVEKFALSKKEFIEAFSEAWLKLHTLGNDDKPLYLEIKKYFDY